MADRRTELSGKVKRLLSEAEKHLSEGNNHQAFLSYLSCAKSSQHPVIIQSLIFTLRELGLFLERAGNYLQLFNSYKEAISVLPNCAEIQNNIGAHLVRYGDIETAAPYFVEALRLNPSFVSAKENLDNISNALVERWHFPMLNDKQRNEMYFAAIESAIRKGCETVLDIGTGTGILSMYAVRSGAKKVYACEVSELMCEIADQVLKNNEMRTQIALYNKHSSLLNIPKCIKERVPLVVTEILDSGLLGEEILLTLYDAWKRLLLRPAKPIYVKHYTKYARVIPAGATVWAACIEYESIRLENRVLKSNVCDINLECLTDERAVDFWPYTTENLDAISKKMNFLTEPVKVTWINFNSPREIKKCIDGLTINFDANVIKDGVIDAVVMWFTLYLDDTHALSSASKTCWEQAVYPVQSSEKILLKRDTKIDLVARIDQCILRISCVAAMNSHSDTLSNTEWNLNHTDIRRLNDDYYWKLINDALIQCNFDQCKVLDATAVPLTALKAVKMNAREVTITEKYNLISHLASANDINKQKINHSNTEISSTQTWDVVIMDVVEPTGLLRQDILETLTLLRYTSKNATFLPNQLLVHAILVESPSIFEMNRLIDDDKVLGVKIADTINQFKVTNHIDINLKQLPHKFLSESIQIFDFNFTDESSNLTKKSNTFHVQITNDGMIYAVVFWFKLRYGEQFLDTFDHDCFFKQACVVLEKPVPVKTGQNVTIKAKCSHSYITIKVE